LFLNVQKRKEKTFQKGFMKHETMNILKGFYYATRG